APARSEVPPRLSSALSTPVSVAELSQRRLRRPRRDFQGGCAKWERSSLERSLNRERRFTTSLENPLLREIGPQVSALRVPPKEIGNEEVVGRYRRERCRQSSDNSTQSELESCQK